MRWVYIAFLQFLLLESSFAAQCSCKPSNNGAKQFEIGEIVGGKKAKKGEFPWQVGLLYSKFSNKQPWCGGTLIANDWVLTAAHCIENKTETDFKVILGAHNWKKTSKKVQKIQVAEIVYDKTIYNNVTCKLFRAR